MSYARNAATPKALCIGPVTVIADGSLATTGAAVSVRLDAGNWGAGGGTLAYSATSQAWDYTPIQAETNGDVLSISVTKAACLGSSLTVLMDPLDLAVNATKIGGTSQTGADVGGIVAHLATIIEVIP